MSAQELRRHCDNAHPSVKDPITKKFPCTWTGCSKHFEVATGARRCIYHHIYDAQAANAPPAVAPAPAAAPVNQAPPPPPPVPAAAALVPVVAPVQVQHQAADQPIDAAGPTIASVSQQLDQMKVLLTDGFGALHRGNEKVLAAINALHTTMEAITAFQGASINPNGTATSTVGQQPHEDKDKEEDQQEEQEDEEEDEEDEDEEDEDEEDEDEEDEDEEDEQDEEEEDDTARPSKRLKV
ncbi:hypothetical protein Daesc_004619 [Daldinia eschscholtzii]|uniref:C2H2-type domain-containing protein n=1 Tax=Daldinia eschscholtzii TaxID=292717 RepID=A0AAX6MR49_9PEZI